MTVEFVNTSMKTYFLEVGCELRYDVTACATAYSEPLVRNGFCAAPCDGPPDCIVCARCPFGAAEVAPGAIVAEGWGGQTFTFGMNGADCQCHIAHVAPAAKYRVVVPVFDSSEAVSNRGMPTHFAQTDFTLPAAGGVVTVDIGSVVGP
ncbi:MAG: hypothetical protein EXR75_03970 [Myxococcales bacterium]|nr:hypothetical protein [Myxococcales bacterium]